MTVKTKKEAKELGNHQKLKDLKKLATKSNTRIINNNHTIIDTLVISTISLLSNGNENGSIRYLDKLIIDIFRRAEKYINELDYYEEEYDIFILCKSVYKSFNNQDFIIKNPKGYGKDRGWF